MVRRLLDGEPGPRRDVVLFNAAAALLIAGHAGSLADGFAQATLSLDSGRAKAALARVLEVCGK